MIAYLFAGSPSFPCLLIYIYYEVISQSKKGLSRAGGKFFWVKCSGTLLKLVQKTQADSNTSSIVLTLPKTPTLLKKELITHVRLVHWSEVHWDCEYRQYDMMEVLTHITPSYQCLSGRSCSACLSFSEQSVDFLAKFSAVFRLYCCLLFIYSRCQPKHQTRKTTCWASSGPTPGPGFV